MPEMVLEAVAARHRLYLTAKPFHVGVDVDGLPCPYAVLQPMGVRLEHRVPCSVLSFFAWLPSLSWKRHYLSGPVCYDRHTGG
jgi:hypothetical protein